MRNKRVKSIIASALAVLIAATSVFGAGTDALAVTQSEIDKLKAESAEIASRKSEIQSQIDSFESEQMSILEKKRVLDEQVQLTQEEIDNITAQIENYKVLIAEKEVEVQQAQEREDEQLKQYQARVRTMEENGSISYLAVIFDAANFSDLLARLDFVFEVMNYDEQLYQSYIEAKEATQAAKQALEDSKAEEEAAKAELENKKDELDADIEEANNFLAEIESNIETYNALYDEAAAAEADLNQEIQDLVAKYEAEQAEIKRRQEEEAARREEENRQNNNNSGNNNSNNGGSNSGNNSGSKPTGSGRFIWPAPASYIITSDYGIRTRDNGTTRMHYGIDIGAGYGTNVLAADSGTVLTTYYHWSYGNFVIIDHGNGYQTLYAHMSRVYVSVGQSVSQGEVIGLVGNTGDSNGAHCHFEVRVNGSCQDPKSYLSGYSYTVW